MDRLNPPPTHPAATILRELAHVVGATAKGRMAAPDGSLDGVRDAASPLTEARS